MNPVEVTRGRSPVILAFPHVGTYVPPAIHECLNENGRLLADTDWHVDRLYDALVPDATTVRATFHRYVIDANRDPAGVSLYPGQSTTALIPATDFDGQPIWVEGKEPTDRDIVLRTDQFHMPYHAALAEEIERIRSIHGVAVLYECHSIRSRIPYLFDGPLPDFNIGTYNGRTCSPILEAAVVDAAHSAFGYTSVLNGRFKGGWTTRRYGQPERDVHAVQMELAQSTYLASEAPPFASDPPKAGAIREHLKTILGRVEQTALCLKDKQDFT